LCQSLVRIRAGFLICVVRTLIVDRCFVCTLCALDTFALDVYWFVRCMPVYKCCRRVRKFHFYCVLGCGFSFVSCCIVFVLLNAMPMSVCLKGWSAYPRTVVGEHCPFFVFVCFVVPCFGCFCRVCDFSCVISLSRKLLL
jgi:hypothetical protein